MLMAQEKLLRFGKKGIGEPCEAHLVIHNVLYIKPALKLLVEMLVSVHPFVFLAKALKMAKFFG